MSRLFAVAFTGQFPRWWGPCALRATALLFLLCAAPAAAEGTAIAPAWQENAVPAAEAPGLDAGGATTAAAESSDPLPTPSMQRAYWHVFLAFGIAWALILAYVVLLNRRLADAERDLLRFAERQR